MNIKLKGMYRNNQTIPIEKRGRSYYIGTIIGGVNLTEKGLTILISDKTFGEFLKNELSLRKFKGCVTNSQNKSKQEE